MKSSLLLLVQLLAVSVESQSAPEFPVVVGENLPVVYAATNTEVTPPGVLLNRNDVLEAPTVSFPEDAEANQTYLVFMIDQDVRLPNGTVTALLHWFQADLHRGLNGSDLAVTILDDNVAPTIGSAEYVPPTPPAGTGAHRYTFLLYEQPDDFAVPEAFASALTPASANRTTRIGFNITGFAAAASLDEPIAANYLRVINGTAEESSFAATQTATEGVAPTEVPSEGPAETSASTTGTSGPGASPTVGSIEEGAAPAIGAGKDLMLGLVLAVAGAVWMT